jgi:DNA repair protein RadC
VRRPSKTNLTKVYFRVLRRGNIGGGSTLLTSPKAVARLARTLIPDDGREHFGVFLLDSALNVLGYHEVGVGSATQAPASPREIFGAALPIPGCTGIICVHNHPSGVSTPSKCDRALTRDLVRAGKLLDLRMHDHIVVGNGTSGFYSFDDAGLLRW